MDSFLFALTLVTALDCDHYLPEEAPEETYAELHAFFDVMLS